MTDSTKNRSTLERVLTALAELGPATATAISESVGIAYPTTTPKLRELESTGHAERVRAAQRTTLWQLTGPGKAAAASITAGDASIQKPSAAPVGDGAPGGGELPRATSQPPAEPEPDAGLPAQGLPLADLQAGESTADTGQATAAPAHGSVGEAEQVAATESAFDPDPASDSDTVEAPLSDPAAACSGATQDPPSGQPHAGDRGSESESGSTPQVAHQPPVSAEGAATSRQEHDGPRKPAQPRRGKGELRDEVLALLRRHPGTAYKVGEICKLINQAHDGGDVNKASAGAVANALDKLVIAGTVTRLDTKVATYQAE